MARRQLVDVVGLAEFQRDLRAAGGDWPKALRRGNKDVAQYVADRGKAELRADDDPVARHVGKLPAAVRARGEQRRALVIVSAKAKRNAMSIGAVLGSKQYPQFGPYDPARWRGGLPTGGKGPYEAIRDDHETIVEMYGDMTTTLYRRAFPLRQRALRR